MKIMLRTYEWKRFRFKNGRVMDGLLLKNRLLLEDGSTIGFSTENVVGAQDVEVENPILKGKLEYMTRYVASHGVQEAIRKWKVLLGEDSMVTPEEFNRVISEVFNGLGYKVSKVHLENGCASAIEVSRMEKAPSDLVQKAMSTSDRKVFMKSVRAALANSGAVNFEFSSIDQVMDFADGTLVHLVRLYTSTVMTRRGLDSFIEDSKKYKVYSVKGALEARAR